MTVSADLMVVHPGKLRGTLRAVPSKSDAHRKLICCALAADPSTLELEMAMAGDDIQATIACLSALGAEFIPVNEHELRIIPIREAPRQAVELDCRESGSTLRFLLPLIAALNANVNLFGQGKLPSRPISPLKEEMQRHGAIFSAEKLPLNLFGQLSGGVYTLPGNISSQYISGLLMALPLLPDDSEIRLTSALESADYVQMTLQTLALFGIEIVASATGFLITGNQSFRAQERCSVEADWSNAAFFLAAGALGAEILVTGLNGNSYQPDRSVLDALALFGCHIDRADEGIAVTKGDLRGCRLSGAQAPDLVPILSVVGCAAAGETQFVHAERLRAKESDRLLAMETCIRSLGGNAQTTADGIRILGGGSLRGGVVDGFSDHRIVMSAAIASLNCREPVRIQGWQAVRKSYPNFFDDFRALGGNADVQYR